jgi:hypothetical protein
MPQEQGESSVDCHFSGLEESQLISQAVTFRPVAKVNAALTEALPTGCRLCHRGANAAVWVAQIPVVNHYHYEMTEKKQRRLPLVRIRLTS